MESPTSPSPPLFQADVAAVAPRGWCPALLPAGCRELSMETWKSVRRMNPQTPERAEEPWNFIRIKGEPVERFSWGVFNFQRSQPPFLSQFPSLSPLAEVLERSRLPKSPHPDPSDASPFCPFLVSLNGIPVGFMDLPSFLSSLRIQFHLWIYHNLFVRTNPSFLSPGGAGPAELPTRSCCPQTQFNPK